MPEGAGEGCERARKGLWFLNGWPTCWSRSGGRVCRRVCHGGTLAVGRVWRAWPPTDRSAVNLGLKTLRASGKAAQSHWGTGWHRVCGLDANFRRSLCHFWLLNFKKTHPKQLSSRRNKSDTHERHLYHHQIYIKAYSVISWHRFESLLINISY